MYTGNRNETYQDDSARDDRGSKLDRELAIKQADALAESLDEQGMWFGASLTRWLSKLAGDLGASLDEARAELAELKAGTKSSRGRERAVATGTISDRGVTREAGGIAPPHKHEYGPDGSCAKVTSGIKCEARRQRNRRPKTATIADANGADAGEVMP